MVTENGGDTPDIDIDLLEDFENEIATEDKARKRKRTIVIAGLLVGVVTALSMADIDWSEFTSTGSEPVATVEIKKTSPAEKPVPVKKVAEPADIEVSKKTEPENIEAEIAKLQEKNMIADDFKAPGMLTDEKQPAPEENVVVAPEPEVVKEVEKTPAVAKEPEVTQKAVAPEVIQKTEPIDIPKPSLGTGTFSVQVVATTDAVRALEIRDKLNKQGFYAWISTGRVKKSLFKVEAGLFKSIREASPLLRKLSSAGFKSRIAYKNDKKNVTLELGVFENERHAKSLGEQLGAKGFEIHIETIDKPIELYIVREGKYKSTKEADEANRRLIKTGYRTLGVNRVY